MTIEKGSKWEIPYELTGNEEIIHSDIELASIATERATPYTLGPIGVLRGGDLFRSLGNSAPPTPQKLSIDLINVESDVGHYVSVAHVVAKRFACVGEWMFAMNATHWGEYLMGPKAHPNDGLVDVTSGQLETRERLKARRRAILGTHVPHPHLTQKRVRAYEQIFDRPTPLFIDGKRVGRARTVQLTVVPDAFEVVI